MDNLSRLIGVALSVDELIRVPQVMGHFQRQSKLYYEWFLQSPNNACHALTLPHRRAFKNIIEHIVPNVGEEQLEPEKTRLTDYVLLTIIYDKTLEGLRDPISEVIWTQDEDWISCIWEEIVKRQDDPEMMTRIDCALEWVQAVLLSGKPEETNPTEVIRLLVDHITGNKQASVMKELLAANINEGEAKRSAKYKEFIHFVRERLRKADFTPQDATQLDEIVNITLGGKTFPITYDTLLSLWMHTEADNLSKLLKTKGMNIDIYKQDPKCQYLMKREEIRTGTPRLQEIRDARLQIPDKFKELGEIAFKINHEKQLQAINETALECWNHEIRRTERHWHISREIEEDSEERPSYWYLNMDEQSRYLPPTGGKQRINLLPFSKEFVWSMQMDANFYGMTRPLEDAKILLCDKEFRKKIKDYGHEKVLDTITTIIRQKILRTFLGT